MRAADLAKCQSVTKFRDEALSKAHFCSRKIPEDVGKYAAEQGFSEDEAVRKGMEEKSKQFVKGADVYTKA